MIERYRSDRPAVASDPIVATTVDAVAYLAYRLPATYAAVRTVLDQLPGTPTPAGQLDLGGGSGAAVWAAADRWPGLGSAEVRDVSAAALDLGRTLARGAPGKAVADARWVRSGLGGRDPLPEADLVTISYLLGELDQPTRDRVVDQGAEAAGRWLVLVEPGSTAGHRRILSARDRLLDAGWQLIAPCPHRLACPLAGTDDWCHFAVRLNRTAAHRRAKQADRGFEDEKFSYLAVGREPAPPAPGRLIGPPREPKGRVHLRVCSGDVSAVDQVTVTRRDGDLFRAARHADWGDAWPPPAAQPQP